MDRRIFSLCRMLTLLSAFWAFEVGAVAYSLPAATFSACTGSWNAATHTCGSRVVFQPGDTLTVSTALTIRANAGFELQGNNSLGVGGATVSLVSTYGDIAVGTGSRVNGSLTSGSGTVELTGAHVEGNVEGDGIGRITDSSIAGDTTFKNGLTALRSIFSGAVTVTNGTANFTDSRVVGEVEVRNVLTAQGSEFGSTVTATNGSISLSGGSVAGRVTTNCCTVTTNQTNLEQGITAHSGISITGGVIAGDFVMTTNNNISLTGVVMTSGSIDAFNIRVSDSDLGSAENPVSLTANGNRLDILNGSTVYGSVVVDNHWGKLTIDSPSAVYGTCLAESTPDTNNNVNGECGAGAPPAIDHFRLSFTTPQFSCEPIPVTIRACVDASCSSTVAVNKTLALTPADRWLGGGTVTLADTDTAMAYLKRIPGTPRLGVVGESYRCSNGDCGLQILESGFAIRVPALIAGQEVAAEVQAMRRDESSGACVADGSFASSERTVALWSAYSAPNSGSRVVWIAGGSIGTHAGDASLRTLRFDAQARSGFPIRYDDAGALDLHVRYLGSGAEDGLDMQGSTTVVSRPYGFCIEAGASLSGCSGADCPLFAVRAGEPFDLRITPVALPAGGNLCAAQPTPNFTGPLELRAPVQEPVGGVDGPLEIDRYAHPLGGRHELRQKLHEVGIFSIEVHSTGYLGGSDFMSQSAPFGRFAPAYLQARLNTPELEAGCVSATGSFSYQDQPIEYAVTPELTITGRSRNGAVTRNYDSGAFWKLGDDILTPSLGFASGAQDASRLSSPGVFKQVESDTPLDGEKAYLFTADHMAYQRAGTGPVASDVPFAPNLVLRIVAGQLRDSDGTCHSAGCSTDFESQPFGFKAPGGEIRLGRIRVGSAHGPEHEPLDLPYQVETWQAGSVFKPDNSDSCSVVSSVALGPYTGKLKDKTLAQVSALVLGSGTIRLTAPGPGGDGSVVVTPQVPDWLTFDWKVNGVPESHSGLATFGIYKGNEKIIFRREIIGR
jgi:MSHA biogenesis protein MshQ